MKTATTKGTTTSTGIAQPAQPAQTIPPIPRGCGTIYRNGASLYYECDRLGIPRQSLKTLDKVEARRIVWQKYGYLFRTTSAAEQLHEARKKVNELTEDANIQDDIATDKIIPFFLEYLDTNKKLNLSPITIRQKVVYFNTFVRYLLAKNIPSVSRITKDIAYDFLDDLEVSKTTYNAYLILYRNLFKIIEKKTKIPNPFKDLEGYGDKAAQSEKQKRIPYTPQQIEDIHTYLKKRYADKPTSHNYFYFIASVVGVECAFRIEDVIVLRKDCFRDCYISITEKKTQNKLTRKAPATIELLKDYMDKFPNDGEFIFPDFVEKYTRYNGFYTYVWKAILKNVGIDVMGTNKKSPAYSYHCYRHSKASELLRRGYTEQEVQEFLHHSSKKITRQYIDDKSKQTIRRVQADKFYKSVGVGGGTQSAEDTPAKRFYASHRVELAGLTAEDLAELRELIAVG